MLLLAALLACQAPAPPPRGTLLVTVDTWRADHLDPQHSPHLWELAREGWRFTHAFSPIGLTSPAHASILTGLFPWEHGMRANNHHGSVLPAAVHTLAEHARDAGWSTAAFVSAWPAGPAGGLDQGFETFDGPEAGERPGGVAVERALAWMDRLGPGEHAFLWVHVYEPHGPYRPPPGDLRAVGGGETDRARYGGEVHAADRLLAPLLRRARDWGWTVAVAADHGEVLDEEVCGYQHERSSSLHVLQVPLLFWGPGVDAREREEWVGLVDLAPTLAELAGLPPWPATSGHSLVPVDGRDPPGRAYWPAESGLCEPDCAPGCSPPGIEGRDRLVLGPGGRGVDRPGAGRWVEGEPPPGWEALLDAIPPARSPEGGDEERARLLGYLPAREPPSKAPSPAGGEKHGRSGL